MLPGRFWQKELLEEWKSRKGLIVRFTVPFLILAPLAAEPVPLPARATGLLMGILFIGIFGSAIGLARIRENRMLERLLVLPIPPSGLLLEYIFANSVADILQLFPPFVVVVVSGSPDPGPAIVLAALFVPAVVAANAIGTLIPLFSGASSEVHLASFIAVIAVVAVSTPFLPVSFSIGQFLPFGSLAAGLLSAWGGLPMPWYNVIAPVASAIALVFMVSACAGRLKASD